MLATLQNVKDYLGITDSSQDTLLTSLLTSADAEVKNYTGRDFEEDTYTHYFNGKGENELLLKQYPVSVLTSLKYNTGSFSSPTWTPFDVDSYKLEEDNGKVWLTFSLPKGIQNIQAIYTAGYSTGNKVLEELKQIVVSLTAYLYNGSKSDGIKSESVDGASLVYDKGTTKMGIPDHIALQLNRYKNVEVF